MLVLKRKEGELIIIKNDKDTIEVTPIKGKNGSGKLYLFDTIRLHEH